MRSYQQVVRSVYGEPRTSFWSGFASALNLFGTSRKPAPRRMRRSEADALHEDWANVSHDLQRAIRQAGCR